MQTTERKPLVTVIDPLKPKPVKLRVAAYCRISTDSEEQLSSYEAQIAYYTEKIAGDPNWTMVRLYADEGITGTSTKKRIDPDT